MQSTSHQQGIICSNDSVTHQTGHASSFAPNVTPYCLTCHPQLSSAMLGSVPDPSVSPWSERSYGQMHLVGGAYIPASCLNQGFAAESERGTVGTHVRCPTPIGTGSPLGLRWLDRGSQYPKPHQDLSRLMYRFAFTHSYVPNFQALTQHAYGSDYKFCSSQPAAVQYHRGDVAATQTVTNPTGTAQNTAAGIPSLSFETNPLLSQASSFTTGSYLGSGTNLRRFQKAEESGHELCTNISSSLTTSHLERAVKTEPNDHTAIDPAITEDDIESWMKKPATLCATQHFKALPKQSVIGDNPQDTVEFHDREDGHNEMTSMDSGEEKNQSESPSFKASIADNTDEMPVPMSFNTQGAKTSSTSELENDTPPKRKHVCDECGRSFTRSSTLVTHKRIHSGDKPFSCETCGRAFRQPGNLSRHRLTHTTSKPYMCVHCNKTFNRASNLHTHMRTHSDYKPYACDFCDKRFHQKVDMKIHRYTHTGEKPHKCGKCGRGFKQLTHLTYHLRTHSDVRMYHCQYCGKGFNQKGNLQAHTYRHTGERPFKCEICGKGFTLTSTRNTHLQTHAKKKPFECKYCDKAFYQKNALKTHYIASHPYTGGMLVL